MNEHLARYLHKHTLTVTTVVVSVFLLLSIGEYFLYRKTIAINKMLSEGLMQLKETKKTDLTPLGMEIMMKGGKLMFKKGTVIQSLNQETILPDGVKIRMDGMMIDRDGNKTRMKEGQSIMIIE